MCIRDLCITITTNWEVYLHIWMVARVGLMRLQQTLFTAGRQRPCLSAWDQFCMMLVRAGGAVLSSRKNESDLTGIPKLTNLPLEEAFW